MKLLLRGLDSSNFMPSGRDTWYFSFSSILTAEEDDDDGEEECGDAAPGSGDASLGGVGGNGYMEPLWDGGEAETGLELLLHG